MLTRSPVAASPSNASPRSGFPGFHYASTSSARTSPARVSAGLARSSSAASLLGSMTASPAPPPKRYVGVDAATQYSPMEPIDYRTGAALSRPPQQEQQQQQQQQQEPAAAAQLLRSVPIEAPSPMAPLDKPAASAASSSSTKQPQSQFPSQTDPPPSTPSSKLAPPPPPPPAAARPPARPAGDMQSGSSSTQPISPSKRRSSQIASGLASAPSAQDLQKLAKRSKPEDAPAKVLPLRYEFCRVEDIVVLIANMLGELIETNDPLALKSGHLTRFHSRTAPGISVLDYLHRLAKHATLTPPLLLSMVYYIDRLCALYPEFTINTLTVHRFLITAATVAAKGLSDAFWNNSTYARVGGVRVAELKMLELEFLYRVDWKIVPNPEVLVSYYRGLVERCPGYKLEDDPSAPADAAEDEEDEDSDEVVEDEEEVDEAQEPSDKSSSDRSSDDSSRLARSVDADQSEIPRSNQG